MTNGGSWKLVALVGLLAAGCLGGGESKSGESANDDPPELACHLSLRRRTLCPESLFFDEQEICITVKWEWECDREANLSEESEFYPCLYEQEALFHHVEEGACPPYDD